MKLQSARACNSQVLLVFVWLSSHTVSDSSSMRESLQSAGYGVLAKIVSTRCHWTIDDFGIDVDETPDGYSVCEVELMVDESTDKTSAEQRVDDLGKKLGLVGGGESLGKMHRYLHKHHPDLLKLLVAKYKK
eukprot:TRINITY_DN64562_c0_g2_i1.p2 TRINITY_DN64562_c0_g2~~TRINITY_DN64562_c0_g2_i1.p2  ORF type:complete len:132 (+),score=10.00 TRINITY_DN64562_c0_g2_i1:325-720(+)